VFWIGLTQEQGGFQIRRFSENSEVSEFEQGTTLTTASDFIDYRELAFPEPIVLPATA
jgi:hypothetical protein